MESLFPAIDRDRITCYNEHQPGAGKRVIKPFSDRLTAECVRANDDDTEFLLVLPFTAAVKLHSLSLITTGHTAATTIRLYINRDDLDMSSINDTTPTETISNIQEDTDGEGEVNFSLCLPLTPLVGVKLNPGPVTDPRTNIRYDTPHDMLRMSIVDAVIKLK